MILIAVTREPRVSSSAFSRAGSGFVSAMMFRLTDNVVETHCHSTVEKILLRSGFRTEKLFNAAHKTFVVSEKRDRLRAAKRREHEKIRQNISRISCDLIPDESIEGDKMSIESN